MAKDSLLNIILNIVKQGTGDKDAKDGMSALDSQLDQTTTSLLGSVLGFTTLAGAVYAGVAAFKADVDAAADEQTALMQLNATIESTGRAGEISAAGLDKMAASPLFTPTQIDQAANALMRFVDIPSQQMPGDLVIIENMAEGLGESLPAAAQTFGMAMETGRTRGLGFSRELTNQISLLMTAGQVQQADAIILDQLSQKYSGQAAAAMDTYNGKQQELKVAEDELNAALGMYTLPTLEKLDEVLLAVVTGGGTAFYDEIVAIDDVIHGNFKGAITEFQDGATTAAHALESAGVASNAYNDTIDQGAALEAWWYAQTKDAATVTDIFTGALLNASAAAKQEKDELDFVVSYSKTYQKGMDSLSQTMLTAQNNIKDYTNDIKYYQNLEQNGPAMLEAERQKLDDVAKQYGVNSAEYDVVKTKLKGLEDGYKGAGGAVEYYTGKIQTEKNTITAAEKATADATNEMIASFLQAQLAADGTFSPEDAQKVLDFRKAVGLLSDQEYEAAMNAMDMAEQIAGIPTNTVVSITTKHIDEYYGSTKLVGDNPPLPKPKLPHALGASGLDFTVPGGFPNDSYGIGVQSGEHVQVTPAGDAGPERATFTPLSGSGGGAGAGTINIYINGSGDPRRVADEVATRLMAQLNMQGIKTRLT